MQSFKIELKRCELIQGKESFVKANEVKVNEIKIFD